MYCRLSTKQISLYKKGYKNLMKEFRVTYWINVKGSKHRTMKTIVTNALNKIQAYDNIKLLESDSGLGYQVKLIKVE